MLELKNLTFEVPLADGSKDKIGRASCRERV